MLAQVELRLSAKTDASWSSQLNVDINSDIYISLADATGKYGGEAELFVPPSGVSQSPITVISNLGAKSVSGCHRKAVG